MESEEQLKYLKTLDKEQLFKELLKEREIVKKLAIKNQYLGKVIVNLNLTIHKMNSKEV